MRIFLSKYSTILSKKFYYDVIALLFITATYRLYENVVASAEQLCVKATCDYAFMTHATGSIMESCDKCHTMHYSICTAIKVSTKPSPFFFCDNSLPGHCIFSNQSIVIKRNDNGGADFNYTCSNDVGIPELPLIDVVDVNKQNFTVHVPNVPVKDYWQRLNIISFSLRLFCPEAYCISPVFDRLANETFLLKEIDLISLSNLSFHRLTFNWSEFMKSIQQGSEDNVKDVDGLGDKAAASMDYVVVYNRTYLHKTYGGSVEERIKTFSNHSPPVTVHYKPPNSKNSNAALLVLAIILSVLVAGMLLACLARRHAVKTLVCRNSRKKKFENNQSNSTSNSANVTYRVSKNNNNNNSGKFEEEFKLLSSPSNDLHSKSDNNNVLLNFPPFLTQNGQNNLQKYEDMCQSPSIVIPFTNLDLLETIGQGQFGPIKRGYVGQKNECMVHCAKAPYAVSAEESKIFLEHLDSSIKAQSHPNVVQFIGVCGQGEDLYIAVQLETGPNLRNLLRESRSLDNFLQYAQSHGRISLMSSQRLLSIMLGVARGMRYLEENKVLHDNLAAVNIIIGENGTPKIGGFGMATILDLYMRQIDKNFKVIRWMPVETLVDHLFSLKSQVWSFGVVLWEIVTLGGVPYSQFGDQYVLEHVPTGLRLHQPTNCGTALFELMANCWHKEAELRPNFNDILRSLHDFSLNPEEHINLNFTNEFAYESTKHLSDDF